MNTTSLIRAQMLLQRDRYAEAEQEVGRALAQSPEDPYALALMARCKLHQDRKREAQAYAARAVAADPEDAYAHYVRGWVLMDIGKLPQARAAAEEAIRLDPTEPNHYALRAAVYLSANRWKEALAAAEQGLEYDAEHDGCQHQRTIALTRLGRHDEADRQMAQTLRQNADDPMAHANRGWSLLHQNRPKEALEAFREAVRLDPGNQYARSGIVEALKARNPIYRLLLAYLLWMVRLPPAARYGVIFGGYILYRVLRSVGKSNPAVEPYVTPVLIAYIAFAVMTWIGVPMFNLLLRLNRFGRHALSRDEIIGSNIFGGMLLATLAALGGYLYFGGGAWQGLALLLALICLPAAAWYAHKDTPTFIPIGIGLAVAMVCCLAAFAMRMGGVPLGGLVFLAGLLTVVVLELFIVIKGASNPSV